MSDDRREDRGGPDGERGRENWLDRLMQRFSLRPRESIREDLQEMLAESEAGDLSPQELAMLDNVLAFHGVRVRDVMVPRADIVAVPMSITLGELLGLFRRIGHSRLPTYDETLDEPLGMVHIRDLLGFVVGQGESQAGEPDGVPHVTDLGGIDLSATLASAEILRPVLFVPGSMPAIELLARMQASRTHIALVIDEYGGTDGLVSIEDLLEAVVGDIEDEHDETPDVIAKDEEGHYVLDGRTSLEDAAEALGRDLAAGMDGEEVDTVGGLVVTRAARVPLKGEFIDGPDGIRFEILDADHRRVKRLRVLEPEGKDGLEASLHARNHLTSYTPRGLDRPS